MSLVITYETLIISFSIKLLYIKILQFYGIFIYDGSFGLIFS